MPSPFPGMDPYLEKPGFWRDVHIELMSGIRAALGPKLRPKYVALLDQRVYISDDDDPAMEYVIPDVRVAVRPNGKRSQRTAPVSTTIEITEPLPITLQREEVEEPFITIKNPKTGELVTIIEVLSPSNKIGGSAGRRDFMDKRREVLSSDVHWVEIDLLRTGKPTVLNSMLRPSDYRVLVSRGEDHLHAHYWPINLRDALPIVGIPLKGKDPDVPLDLGAVLESAYDRACWDGAIDYSQPAEPPLKPDDAKWANKLLRLKGLR